jgi:hypothetical protein
MGENCGNLMSPRLTRLVRNGAGRPSNWNARMGRRRLLATTLILALGCDKARQLAGGSASAETADAPSAPRLDLSSRPDMLFQVYGERDDPRMIPVGVLRGGKIEEINLGSSGWKQFDGLYGKPGASYNAYQGGRSVGKVTVRQGMWEQGKDPLYTLPSCNLMVPQAAVTLDAMGKPGYTVSLFASTTPLHEMPVTSMDQGEVDRIGRQVADRVGLGAGIDRAVLDSLNFHATAVATGVSKFPTIVITLIDRRADEQSAAREHTSHLLIVADRGEGASEYSPSFKHIVDGDASTGDFRRFIDQVDVSGGERAELVLEGWKFGGDTFLLFLQYNNGAWTEAFRGRSSWCLDDATR